MKILVNIVVISFAVFLSFFVSCSEENVIPVNSEFTVSNEALGDSLLCYVGTPINVVKKGSAEFISIYTGKLGSVYGEAGAVGIDYNKADSVELSYSVGRYVLTTVSTSAAKFGGEVIREVKSTILNVIDIRNSFKEFNVIVPELGVAFQKVPGVFANDSTIALTLPDVITDFKFKADFILDSDSAVVRVNDVLQVTKVTQNDFVPNTTVKYSIMADYGNLKNYYVQLKLVPSSNEKNLVLFQFGANGKGEKAIINNTDLTLEITPLVGTTLSGVRLVLQADNFTTIQIGRETAGVTTFTNFNDRTAYNMSNTGTNQVKSIKVIAQNKTEQIYTVKVIN